VIEQRIQRVEDRAAERMQHLEIEVRCGKRQDERRTDRFGWVAGQRNFHRVPAQAGGESELWRDRAEQAIDDVELMVGIDVVARTDVFIEDEDPARAEYVVHRPEE